MAHRGREYTRRLIDAIDEGIISREAVITAALQHMSEDDVRGMCEANGFLPEDDEDGDEGEEDGPCPATMWYDTSRELD